MKKIIRTVLLAGMAWSAITLAVAQTFAPNPVPVPPITGTGDYIVTVDKPLYRPGKGPRVVVDEAHNNY